MTTRIRRSTTAGAVPASLVSGEIAINEADGKLFYRAASGTVTQLATGGGGSGSVPDPYDLGTYPLITISAQPSAASVTAGNSATFSATAAATLPTATIAYQWQVSTDSGSTWSAVSGATSSSLTLSSVQSGSNGYRYRCQLTANLSQIFSSSATLTVVSGTPFSATPAGWTGSGTSASPVLPNAAWSTAKTLTAGISGTLRITGSVTVDIDDVAGVIQVNGVTVKSFTSNSLTQTVNVSTSITAGQVVTFTAWPFAVYSNYGTNLQIWIVF
jgi:hypothetical protein